MSRGKGQPPAASYSYQPMPNRWKYQTPTVSYVETETPYFRTPTKPNSSGYTPVSDQQKTSRKKYPATWKLYVLPDLELSPEEEEKPRHSIGTTKCSQISSWKRSRLGSTRVALEEHCTIHSRSSSDSEASNTDFEANRIEQQPKPREKIVLDTPRQAPQPVSRLELENKYLKDEVEYLRDKFTNCLIRKFKPGCKNLYD